MIHEFIDQKKKSNRTTASKNTKTFQDPKTISEETNFEASDSENKGSSSTIFIPPWLRNSLGLSQRNNLSHAAGGSDVKSGKLNQRSKEPSQNEFEPLKTNTPEQDCCKKVDQHFELLPQEVNTTQGSDDVEGVDHSERPTPIYWEVRQKESEADWSCTNAETKPLKKEESKMTGTDVFTTADVEKLKEEDKKRLKLMKQRNKLRKRLMGDSKLSDLDKNEVDFLLEMKAREALDNYMKGGDEMKHLEAKLLLLSAKSRDLSNSKPNQVDLRMLHEVKNQGGAELEKVLEYVKDVSLKGVVRNADFSSRTASEKKRDEKEEKCVREAAQRSNDEGKSKGDKDSLLSTDDENDIKRFSDFLSKNKNLDEKRKCLEEVRNYFERKRRTRLTKRRCLEEGKAKLSPDGGRKEELLPKEKIKPREVYRGRKSKFALCDEEVVEKAVDEALQKFVELYHFRVSPSIMGNMKKNILQAITTDSLEARGSTLNESTPADTESKKMNLDLLNMAEKEPEEVGTNSFLDTEVAEVPNRDPVVPKDTKKKTKSPNETLDEQVSKLISEANEIENEKLKRLKKEFDAFLSSIKNHIDITNLKLQSIILEKEEKAMSSQNVQFVYNFTKKALEPDRADYWPTLKEVLDMKSRRDAETQTGAETEPSKRSVKIQALEQKCNCEQELQTDEVTYDTQNTQTEGEGMTMKEIKELKTCDVNPGLYRMVRSKEAGKFYLYPEPLNDTKHDVCGNSNSSVVRDRKVHKRKNLVNLLSKERTRERQVFFRDRDRSKLKKTRKGQVSAFAHVRGDEGQDRKNSINCLYFRNFDKKGSGSMSSKKDFTDENLTGRMNEMRIGDAQDDHLGCCWFWDGEKIGPGCDLKTHVENLLKEKLMQITNAGVKLEEAAVTEPSQEKKQEDQFLLPKIVDKNLDVKNANAIFCFNNAKKSGEENSSELQDENLEEKKRTLAVENKKGENEELAESVTASQEKSVKNVSTQNSKLEFTSWNLERIKTQTGIATTVRRKCTRRNLYIKPVHKKLVNLKKAEDLIRAVEQIKKMKLEFGKKKENSTESESVLDCSTSTSFSKNGAEAPFSVALGLKDGPEGEEILSSEMKNRLKKLIGLVDREVQTTEVYDVEDENSVESQAVETILESHKHLDLIGNVLGGVNRRERQGLWNDLREFIKMKIGRDINDEGAKEVCIEIEQDVPKHEQGRMKHSIMAKGHYLKNEGDVEVEIDLTLEDLAKILRQRQKKTRRRNLYRSSKSRNFLSSSSGHSDFNRDDFRRYQRYLHRFGLGEALVQRKESKAFKKNKAN